MAKYKLDKVEQEILDAFETGKLKPIPNARQEIEKHKKYATATFKKDKRINIRISSRGLSAIQKLTLSESIPYQTLITSILQNTQKVNTWKNNPANKDCSRSETNQAVIL